MWFGHSTTGRGRVKTKRENNTRPKMLMLNKKLLFTCSLLVGGLPEPMRQTKLLKDGE